MPDVDLRPLRREDLLLVTRWLLQPHVRAWWGDDPHDLPGVEADYLPAIEGREPTEVFVICTGGRAVGLIQRYRVADYPEWQQVLEPIVPVADAAAVDYLLGERDVLRQGIGTAAITATVASTYERWPVTSVVVPVQQANRASWRALERSGFTRVWAGLLDSPDPTDAGPAYVYVHRRP